MHEHIESEEEEQGGEEEERVPSAQSAGLVRGIPGRRIKTAGVLDLRGVPAEEVAKIEHIEVAGVILADPANRAALGEVPMQLAGSVVVAPPDLRVIVQPDLEVTKAMLEGMSAGQKVMMVGNVFFKPEVPPSLAAEKFEDLRIVGILLACEGLLGAMFGKLEITGVTITLSDTAAAVVRATGKTEITADYLSRFEDGTIYVNIGQTALASDLPEDLVAQKIAQYHNVGQTTGPERLLNLLRSRCPTNLGEFQVARGEPAGVAGRSVGNFGRRTISRAFLERLEDNCSYENYGETIIADDVPEELLLRKIARYTNYGRTVGPAALIAAMEDRCINNYGVFEEAGEGGRERGKSHFENHGEMTLTREDLLRMKDRSSFENHGDLTLAQDLPEDLLDQKIGYYENHGTIYGPARLLAVLKTRGENYGDFVVRGEGQQSQEGRG